MALGSFVSNILLQVKADVGQAKAELKSLSAEQKKHQESLIASMEKSNKGIENQIKAIGLLGAGFAAAKGAIGLAKDGLDEYAKTSASAKKEVDELEKSMSSSFRDMKVAIGEAVVAIAPLVKAVGALAAGLGAAAAAAVKIPGVLLFGDRNGSHNPYSWNLSGLSGTGPDQTAWQSHIAEIDRGGAITDEMGRVLSYGTGSGVYDWASDAQSGMSAADLAQARDPWGSHGGPSLGERGKLMLDTLKIQYELDQKRREAAKKWAAEHGTAKDRETFSNYLNTVSLDRYQDPFSGGFSATGTLGLDSRALNAALGRSNERSSRESRYSEFSSRKNASFMEQTFGPIGEFNAYAEAWNSLTSGVAAGFEAMVDGSMSFGAAFKQSIASALKAMGSQMLVEALKETAYGIGSLATGHLGPAALHFKSAAAFGAAAVAAGVAAHGLGGGGGSGGAGAAAAPTATGYGGGAGAARSSGSNVTIVYGDAFAEDSPRRRQLKAKRIVDSALAGTGLEQTG